METTSSLATRGIAPRYPLHRLWLPRVLALHLVPPLSYLCASQKLHDVLRCLRVRKESGDRCVPVEAIRVSLFVLFRRHAFPKFILSPPPPATFFKQVYSCLSRTSSAPPACVGFALLYAFEVRADESVFCLQLVVSCGDPLWRSRGLLIHPLRWDQVVRSVSRTPPNEPVLGFLPFRVCGCPVDMR